MSDLRSKFLDVYQVLKSKLSNDPAIELVDFSRQWVDHAFTNIFLDFSMLDLHNTRGKLINQGPSVLECYKLLKEGKEIDDNDIFLTSALDWCIEWFKAFFLDLDDILDKPHTRKDQDCWFKAPKIRMFAAQDGVILRQSIQRVLREYFREKTYYVDLLELFNEVEFQTANGQMNNLLITKEEEEKKLSQYSLDLYWRVVHYKRSNYLFCLPVACSLLVFGEKLEDHIDTKRILIDIERYFQVQMDYLDCFGDPQSKETGTDIEDSKCSWLVVKALELCNDEEKTVLHENYGKQDPACVARVKEIYNNLNLQGEFADYERQSYARLVESIEAHTSIAVRAVLKSLLAEVYKRQSLRNGENILF